MSLNKKAKEALDAIIRKSRVHLYKPIQIAEILFRHRTEKGWDLEDLESYRNVSKKWRDEISVRLVGRRSTSSQKYQDNVFEANAMPPKLLKILGDINKKEAGRIEAFIYTALKSRLINVYEVKEYIKKSTPENFSLRKLVSLFENSLGLKRSIDKMYEILVYALFTAIVRALKVRITMEIRNPDKEMLKDFDVFIEKVLGFVPKSVQMVMSAALFRAGVANAADKGLDMWTNFGAAIQVKHIALTPDILEDISDDICADRIVIVCLTSEKKAIEAVLGQVGWGGKIQGIVTIDDLDKWYKICLSKKYESSVGAHLLKDVEREFDCEFPSSLEIEPFMKERGYDKLLASKK